MRSKVIACVRDRNADFYRQAFAQAALEEPVLATNVHELLSSLDYSSAIMEVRDGVYDRVDYILEAPATFGLDKTVCGLIEDVRYDLGYAADCVDFRAVVDAERTYTKLMGIPGKTFHSYDSNLDYRTFLSETLVFFDKVRLSNPHGFDTGNLPFGKTNQDFSRDTAKPDLSLLLTDEYRLLADLTQLLARK